MTHPILTDDVIEKALRAYARALNKGSGATHKACLRAALSAALPMILPIGLEDGTADGQVVTLVWDQAASRWQMHQFLPETMPRSLTNTEGK